MSLLTTIAAMGQGDVTPDAIDWGNISDTASPIATATTTTETFTGISAPIDVRVTYTGSYLAVTYSLNGGGGTTLNSGDTISIVNNDTLAFTFSANASTSGTATVINDSDGSTTLDTFTVTLTV